MDWNEKLKRLIRDRNAAELSRAAGLPESAIAASVSKKTLPRADKAVKIARALNVTTDWLFDDSKEWSDLEKATGQEIDLAGLSDYELIRILEQRIRRAAELSAEEARILKSIPTEREKRTQPQRDALSNIMLRHAQSKSLHLWSLQCLVSIGDRISNLDSEIRRLIGFGATWPGESAHAAVRDSLNIMKEIFLEVGEKMPWERPRDEESNQSDQTNPRQKRKPSGRK